MSSVVLFDTIKTHHHFNIAVATLNQAQVLNAFSYEMALLLQEKMREWERDDSIVAVILKGAGDKAFCAGGDLHALYQSMLENTDGSAWDNRYVREFFEHEYRLDYHIHTYRKPVICYGNGIVMGGGMGLMMGASHRIVTETTRMAMPEVSIALFPDVGASWMLNRLPGKTGKFLAATGAQIGASDALFLGLADYAIQSSQWENIVEDLKKAAWSPPIHRQDNDELLNSLLSHYSMEITMGPVQRHYAEINALSRHIDRVKQYHAYANLVHHEDEWLVRAANTMLKGSPLSFALAMDLQERTRHLSLAEVFRIEHTVAVHCGQKGQFQEGIRALLIDKDKNPHWSPASIEDVSDDMLDTFYQNPMPDNENHPLSDL